MSQIPDYKLSTSISERGFIGLSTITYSNDIYFKHYFTLVQSIYKYIKNLVTY